MKLHHKTAFTLIEVVIVLFLMASLITLVGSAISTHLRILDSSRTEVAEAQLARALLEKIARDLRNTVVAVKQETLEVDTTSVSEILGSQSGTAVNDVLSAVTGESESSESSSAPAKSGTVAGTSPGIYGDLEWLQIDTAKLPRGENFRSKITHSGTSPLADRLSPSKTVLYYLGEDTGTGTRTIKEIDDSLGALGYSYERGASAIRCGLYRREMDRLATEYMVNEGLETEREECDELIAPELEAIEFLYFDQTIESTSRTSSSSAQGDWAEAWDMSENGALPRAVRITIWLRRQSPQKSYFASGQESVSTVAYSLVVVLPVVSESTSGTDEAASGGE
jgi:type II secretory pathway pseudopilin PulG